MIRSPSEPSPFATVRCPFDTQANCRRPYCPFAHQPDEDDVVEDSENDVVLLEDEELADDDDAQSSSSPPPVTTPTTTTTEIRQENPTDLFSGGYVGYVSQNNPNSNFPMVVSSSHHQNLQQPPPQQQQGHIFFPNLPPNHQHQATLVFPSFQPSAGMPPYAAAAPPSHFITHTHPHQYANAMP
uniref:C3H1-type domain-containing protein n=1 Tax=Globodera rostochiensis TaxID=31243 RepID=A0A914I017_GLORO